VAREKQNYLCEAEGSEEAMRLHVLAAVAFALMALLALLSVLGPGRPQMSGYGLMVICAVASGVNIFLAWRSRSNSSKH
jgi:uncharacterized membrane protein